jgi:hypothetical protein
MYRGGSSETWKDKTLLPRQIELIRNTPNLQGMTFFSSNTFEKNPNGWTDSLRLNYFKDSVPVPKIKDR